MITSNESAPATPSAQQPAGNAGFGAQLRSFLLSNLAAAVGALWSVFLFVGGLIFLVYFASIGFMPEVDLQTSIALLVVSALTGGFLLLALGVYLLAPGWWWVHVTRHQESLKSPGWFCWPMLGIILSAFLIPRQYLLLVAVIFFWLFIPLNTWTFIPKRVMSIFKFGNLQHASLVLNEIGCGIVQHHGLKVTPYTLDSKPDSPNHKTCALPNVMIHSRLGNTYYLEVSCSGDASMHFTIPGQNVLSWAVNEPKKAATAGSPASTQNPAPTTEIAPPNKGMEPTR